MGNQPMTTIKPLTAAQLKRHPLSAAERTAKLLAYKKFNGFNTPINIGPLRVKRATGVFGSV